MTHEGYLLLVAGMGAVTFIPRWLPIFFLSNRRLPQWLVEWLDLIPVSILSALLVPELLTTGVPRHFSLFHPAFFAAIPTFLFSLKTRSLGGTVVAGMLLYWLMENLMQRFL